MRCSLQQGAATWADRQANCSRQGILCLCIIMQGVVLHCTIMMYGSMSMEAMGTHACLCNLACITMHL